MSDGSVRFAGIEELGRRLRAGEFSATELARDVIDRLRTDGEAMHHVAEVTADVAQAQAREADNRLSSDESPLLGIPYGMKDMIGAKGVPTRWGSRAFEDQIFDYDAGVVERLRAAGAPLAAMLAMLELGGPGSYQYPNSNRNGAAQNPWNREHWTGGSSSGSAGAVAAGVVPFALATDTMGSIMSPSAFCGVTGFRPSHGAVSNYGLIPVAWSTDRIGPIARSAEDCALVAAAIMGLDPRDPVSIDLPYTPSSKAASELRIGVLQTDLSAAPATPAVLDAAVQVFGRLGAKITEVPLPPYNWGPIGLALIEGEFVAIHEDFIRSDGVDLLTCPKQQKGLRAYLDQPPFAYAKAARERVFAAQKIRALFDDIDVLIAPTVPAEAPTLDTDLTINTAGWRGPLGVYGGIAGLPAVSVPMGFGPQGLPLGLSIVGDRYDDALALRAAMLFQRATDWHLQRPPAH